MKNILPTIQLDQSQGTGSLIKKQIQATRNAIEWERERFEQAKVRKNELLIQKRSRRITNAKSKELDRKLKDIDEQFNRQVNPYIFDAREALKLKITDFSIEDK